MGVWLDARIEVHTFTNSALNRVKNLKLDQLFDLPGEFYGFGNQLHYNESLNNNFEAEMIVRKIAEELNGEGTVSATYKCEEDMPEAFTYYHFGDGVKVVYFSSGYGEDDLYSRHAQHAALLHFSMEELIEIYREELEYVYNEEEAALYKTYDELIEVILEIMNECVYEEGEGFFDPPYLTKVLEQIYRNAEICRYDCDDYEPNLGWEEKRYTCFSEIEKAYFSSKTMDELNNTLKTIKKTTDKKDESSKKSSETKRKTKKTAEGSDNLKQETIHKTEQSNANGSWRDQYIQEETESDEEETWTPATDFIYVNNGEEVQINGYTGPGGFIRVPDKIEGNPVTRIAAKAFYDNMDITGISLPNELHLIGTMAFCGCSNLSGTLIIPQSVKKIESHSFMLSNLTDIVIQASCEVAVNAFANIHHLKSVYIKKGCSPKIGTAVFANSPDFAEFIVPEDVKEINNDNFTACNLLTIYTPAGTYTSDYARRNFIRCNINDYERINAEYNSRYNSYPQIKPERLLPEPIEKESGKESDEEVLPDEQPDETDIPEGKFGENIWHFVNGTDYEFRIFGFAGDESPIIIQVRDAETKKLIGTTAETVDFSETAPEGDYEITTDYGVSDIEALSSDSFVFNWRATFLQDGVEVYDTCSEITINLDEDTDEKELDSSENDQLATNGNIYLPDDLLLEDPGEMTENEKTEEDSFDTAVNTKVREEFIRQISEKKTELGNLVMKGERIQKEIELLEDMLRRTMDDQ